MFRIRQKVVCVNDSPKPNYPKELQIGRVYTIRHISHGYPDGLCGIHLQEVPDRYDRPGGLGPQGFYPWRFRPLIEKSTDTGMAILKEILERETVRDPVRATS